MTWQTPKICMSDSSREAPRGKMASGDPKFPSWPHGKGLFLSSAAPNHSLLQCIPTSPCAGSAPALRLLTQRWTPSRLRPASALPVQTAAVWGEAHAKAPWVGASFLTDALQLLPASSPLRWIISLHRVCNYRLCHLPGWGAGADGRMFILQVPPAGCLGQRGGRRGCSGERDDAAFREEGISREKPPNHPLCYEEATSRCCQCCRWEGTRTS